MALIFTHTLKPIEVKPPPVVALTFSTAMPEDVVVSFTEDLDLTTAQARSSFYETTGVPLTAEHVNVTAVISAESDFMLLRTITCTVLVLMQIVTFYCAFLVLRTLRWWKTSDNNAARSLPKVLAVVTSVSQVLQLLFIVSVANKTWQFGAAGCHLYGFTQMGCVLGSVFASALSVAQINPKNLGETMWLFLAGLLYILVTSLPPVLGFGGYHIASGFVCTVRATIWSSVFLFVAPVLTLSLLLALVSRWFGSTASPMGVGDGNERKRTQSSTPYLLQTANSRLIPAATMFLPPILWLPYGLMLVLQSQEPVDGEIQIAGILIGFGYAPACAVVSALMCRLATAGQSLGNDAIGQTLL